MMDEREQREHDDQVRRMIEQGIGEPSEILEMIGDCEEQMRRPLYDMLFALSRDSIDELPANCQMHQLDVK